MTHGPQCVGVVTPPVDHRASRSRHLQLSSGRTEMDGSATAQPGPMRRSRFWDCGRASSWRCAACTKRCTTSPRCARPRRRWFALADGAELQIYDSIDHYHAFFSTAPVPGLFVTDFNSTAGTLTAAGVEWMTEPETSAGRVWRHYRAPDGNIYEVMGKTHHSGHAEPADEPCHRAPYRSPVTARISGHLARPCRLLIRHNSIGPAETPPRGVSDLPHYHKRRGAPELPGQSSWTTTPPTAPHPAGLAEPAQAVPPALHADCGSPGIVKGSLCGFSGEGGALVVVR